MLATVIIPTYNYARYITEAIESVSLQDYPQEQIEIIVVDDGSTDDTFNVLQPFIESGKVQYFYQENAGKAAATRKGIAVSSGEIVFNLDADDYFLAGKISHTVALFHANTNLVHVSSPASIVYTSGSATPEPIPTFLLNRVLNGTETLRYFFDYKLLYGGGSTFAARASVLKQVYWDAKVDMYTDEWLLIETLLKGELYFLPQPLSVWRVHGNNYSGRGETAHLEQKHLRMENSSAAILQILRNGDYPKWLVNAYTLKHEVRKMVWLEERRQKTIRDIARFFIEGILSGNSFSVLRRYHAFNRLAPIKMK